jgi:hypothetical protein
MQEADFQGAPIKITVKSQKMDLDTISRVYACARLWG